MRELLHPPAHRGPLIAAGAFMLTLGVALLEVRMDWSAGVHFAVLLVLAVKLLWLALQAPSDGAAPYPHQSVLIALGLAASGGALVRLADVLVAFPPGSGTVAWTSAAESALAAWVSVRRRSAFAALIAAVSGGVAFVFFWVWAVEPSPGVIRWLLLVLAFVYGIASLPLRGESGRHADQMVNAAGLAILAIGFVRLGVPELPAAWPAVALVGGVSLAAYAAADRAPGAAYLGAANLVAFILSADHGGWFWWPAFLLAVGGVMVVVGLRPRRPLPPEPEASTRPDDTPLAVRVDRD